MKKIICLFKGHDLAFYDKTRLLDGQYVIKNRCIRCDKEYRHYTGIL